MWIYSFFLVQDWICWGIKPEIIDPRFICLHASFFNYHKNSQPEEGQFGLLSIRCRLILYFSIEEAKISCFLELERLCAGLDFSFKSNLGCSRWKSIRIQSYLFLELTSNQISPIQSDSIKLCPVLSRTFFSMLKSISCTDSEFKVVCVCWDILWGAFLPLFVRGNAVRRSLM